MMNLFYPSILARICHLLLIYNCQDKPVGSVKLESINSLVLLGWNYSATSVYERS